MTTKFTDTGREKSSDSHVGFSCDDTVFLHASDFTRPGGWIADSQFFGQTDSVHLLAHGLGTPVEDAIASFHIRHAGEYRLWVHTRDWTAYWSKGSSAGRFRIKIDGRELPMVFGTGSPDWKWTEGGNIRLSEGAHRIALHDLTGFDARCDALLLTLTDRRPEDSPQELTRLRKTFTGLPSVPEERGSFDLVVAGGGIAGICASITAARLGLKVALIHDRRVLGGNNSSEVRVGLGGRINIGLYPSLGYLLNELGPEHKGNARPAATYEDDKKMQLVKAESNITLFTGFRVTTVEKDSQGLLSAVVATDMQSLARIRVRGKFFSDCTGDATLGVLAGAEWRMGREAHCEYGEPSAPDAADGMTMGASLQWYCREENAPCSFPDIDWGLPLTEETVQKVRRGQWYWEVGMREDQIEEAERIRDYGMYVAYSNFSYLKNRYSNREEYATCRLEWVSHVMGKRESRRLLGEFVLREQDLKQHTIYPDASVSTSWYVDLHYPDPENSRHFPGREYLSVGRLDPIPFYPIPYRCFYSKDVANLFMAGRNISVTHIALGTVRVMRTTAMMGEVVGMAASVCLKYSALPRDVYAFHFSDLQALMRKGIGRTDIPYLQVYTLIDTTGERSEEC